MKKILFLIIIIITTTYSFGQQWKDYLPENKPEKELTFFDYQNAFKEYKLKYNSKNGKYLKKDNEIGLPGYKNFKRWEWYWEQRVDPLTGEFPKKTDWETIKEHKNNNPNMYRVVANENWQNIGATTTDDWGTESGLGRVKTIGFHPTNNDVFWVGSDSGGLWKTIDGGENYTPLTDDLGYEAIHQIYVPSNHATTQILYILVDSSPNSENSNFSKKLFKSQDSGLTWSELNPANLPNGHVYNKFSFKYEVNNPNIIYALMTYDGNSSFNGWYKSIDSGNTWTNIGIPASGSLIATAQAVHPTDYNIGYKFESYGKFYKTIDGGATWVLKETFSGGAGAYYQHIAICKSQPNVIYTTVGSQGHLGGLFKSTDGGETFTNIVDGNSNYWGYATSKPSGQGELFVNPNNPNDVVTGSLRGWRSLDGGNTWSILTGSHADKHFYAIQPNTGFLFEGNDGGVAKYDTNFGPSINLSQGLIISQIYKIGTSQTDENELLYGTQDNGTFGLNAVTNYEWSEIGGGDGMDCAIAPNNTNIQYLSIQEGLFIKTTDKWVTQNSLTPNYPASFSGSWVTPIILHPMNSDIFWLNGNQTIKTTDGGNTFNFVTHGKPFVVSNANPSVIYKVNDTFLSKSIDGGSNWSDITSNVGVTHNLYISTITISDNDPETVWISSKSYTETSSGNHFTAKMFKTSDGGQNWTNITGSLPDINISATVFNKQLTTENEIYIGNLGGGLYVKRGSANWVAFMTNLTSAPITDMEIYYDTNLLNSKIRIGTYGRGLWQSNLYDGSSLSVNDFRIDNISIFPNPTNDFLNIKSTKLIKNVIFYNVLGQKIINYTITENKQLKIDISNLPNGTYIVNILLQNGNKEIKKLIKN